MAKTIGYFPTIEGKPARGIEELAGLAELLATQRVRITIESK
jgi:hypothetical protein